MNAFPESGPRGVKTRPPSFFPSRLRLGLTFFQWGSNPHNPPANFYPDFTFIIISVTPHGQISSTHTAYALNFKQSVHHKKASKCHTVAGLGSSMGFSTGLQCAWALWPSGCGGPRLKLRALWLTGSYGLISTYSETNISGRHRGSACVLLNL